MSLNKQKRFYTTFFFTLISLIGIIVIVEKLFGTPVATIVGTIAGSFALKNFDKLDSNPSLSLEFPNFCKSFLLSTAVSGLILVGSISFVSGILKYGEVFFGGNVYCNIFFVIIGFLFKWGSFVVAGLLIGKFFPRRALTLTIIAAALGFITFYPQVYLANTIEKLECLFEPDSNVYVQENLNSFSQGAHVGNIVAFILKSYVAILFARFSSKFNDPKS